MNAVAAPEPTPQQPGDDSRRESLVALNQSVRSLIQQTRISQADPDVLDAARDAIEKAEAILSPFAHTGSLAQADLTGVSPNETKDHEITDIFPYSPLVGPLNPIAPPITFTSIDGVVHGRATWGAAYCGPPNHVHGGIIAAAFDELLGTVNMVNGVGAMTGTLTIRYRNPTPLHQEIRMEGHCKRIEGRKVFAEGTLWHGETLLAEADGVFIQFSEDFRSEMLSRGPLAQPPSEAGKEHS